MVSFSTAVSFLLLIIGAPASSMLRSVSQHGRRLSHELIAFYEPKSQVTDQNAIDLDQEAIEDQLALETERSYQVARDIYENGGFSKSVAAITLDSPLTKPVSEGDLVTGMSADGTSIYGSSYTGYPSGESNIEVVYKTTDIQKSYMNLGCQVGGLAKPNLAGCFAPSGMLDIGGDNFSYTYNPKAANVNKRTIQGFSTGSEEMMYRCENCPHKTYKKYRDYYGFFDYADKWILAAFDGTSTKFSRGNANFATYGYDGRSEAIKKATAYMSIWMYVLGSLEVALDDCKEGCKMANCNDDPIHAWDQAVALYTGSLEGVDGTGSGKLAYALADQICQDFKTCGDLAKETDGSSHVNQVIFREFALGSREMLRGKCSNAKPHKERIETMIAVPLIQGALQSAYITSTSKNPDEQSEAEGAVFAASVLPLVHACDEDAASTIYKNMKTGQKNILNFAEVKKSFESVYDCMGIRGSDVGGLFNDDTGDYYAGASPLSASSSKSSSGEQNIGLIIGCTVAGLVVGVLLYFVLSKSCRGKADKAVDTEVKEDPTSEDPMKVADSEGEVVEIS